MNNIKFEQSQNIFAHGMCLRGSTVMEADLSTFKKRLCSTCKNEVSKNNCKLLGEIKESDSWYCSWWREKTNRKIKTKRCSACGEVKPISQFYKNETLLGGYQYNCMK